MMKTVLLTGASGFIGRHCIQPLITRGYQIHATTTKQQAAIKGVEWHQIDLHDHHAVKHLLTTIKASHLLHLAWFAKPDEYWTSPHNLTWLMSSIELLRAFIQAGGKRTLFIGSCAEYNWSYEHCDEVKTPCEPKTLYGAAKHSLYLLSNSIAKQHQHSFAWGRLFYLFGSHEYTSRLVPSIILNLLQGNEFHIKHSEQVRDFMYVQDVADALVSLLESEVTGAVNIASGEAIYLREFASLIANQLNLPHAINYANENSIHARLTAETTRLNQEVKWQPSFTLQKALEETITWWRRSYYG